MDSQDVARRAIIHLANPLGFVKCIIAEVREADRFYPSSKRCSKCGQVKQELSLSERTYQCENPECLNVEDRDFNAALNLKALAASSAVTACRPGSAGRSRKTSTKLLAGQEPSRENQAYV